MKRMIFCGVTIVLIFTLCLVTSLYIRKESKEISEHLENSLKYLDEGNKEKASIEIDKITKEWAKIEFITDAMVYNRNNIDICVSVARLKPYFNTDNDELYAEIYACKELLKRLYEAELRI
jgi:hypothetical protein